MAVTAVGILDLGTRELHAPSDVHGVAVCGVRMPDAGWMAGPLYNLIDRADYFCEECFQVTRGV